MPFMDQELRILVSAAERSGDMHAANLIRELRSQDGRLRFEGFGGELMSASGCRIHADLVSLASMGLGFRKHLFRYYGVLRKFQHLLVSLRPAAVLLVDSPGLNFALARLARWYKVPVIYYICPQIWAWAPWRRSKVLKYTNLLVVILPFEEDLYRNPRVPVHYVGHPLADQLAAVPPGAGARLRSELGIGPGERVISLLPGSREHEVRELMPIFTAILDRLPRDIGRCHVLASCFRGEYRPRIEGALAGCRFPFHVLGEDSTTIAEAGDLVLVASGTAALEVAYFEKPMIVLYKAGRVARFFFKLMSVTPYFTLPNILGARLFGGERVVEERLCRGDEAGELALLAGSLLGLGPAREEAVLRLRRLKDHIFAPGATCRAAGAVLDFLAGRSAAPADSRT